MFLSHNWDCDHIDSDGNERTNSAIQPRSASHDEIQSSAREGIIENVISQEDEEEVDPSLEDMDVVRVSTHF